MHGEQSLKELWLYQQYFNQRRDSVQCNNVRSHELLQLSSLKKAKRANSDEQQKDALVQNKYQPHDQIIEEEASEMNREMSTFNDDVCS